MPTILTLGVIVLGKATADRETRISIFPKFLLAETLLMAFAAATVLLFAGPPKSYFGFTIGSGFFGMLLNLPAVIVLKILALFTKSPAKTSEDVKK